MVVSELINRIGFTVDKKDVDKVNGVFNDIKSTANNLLGAIGLTLSVAGIKNFLDGCVVVSSEVEEMENKFNVVFGEMADEVDEWAERYADAIGRNKDSIKTYLADQQNLLVGFGMTRAEGAKLAEDMTSLALDLASFSNMDEASAVNYMTKAVMGESEAAKMIGAVLTDTTRAEAMAALGYQGTYDKLSQLEKMMVNYNAILMQNPDAVGDCQRSLGSYQSTLNSFNAKLKEVKTIIGQFFMPTFQKVLSFGAKGLTMLRNILSKINEFADKMGGSTKVLAIFGATMTPIILALMGFSKAKALELLAKGVRGLGNAFKFLTSKAMLVAGIILLICLVLDDLITFVKGGDSAIGWFLERIGIDTEKVRNTLITAWNTVKNFLLNVWGVISKAASVAFGWIGDIIKKLIKNGLDNFAARVKITTNIIIAIWQLLKRVATAVFGALKDFWDKNGAQIKDSFVRIWTSLVSILSSLWNGIKTAAVIIFGFLKQFWETWGSTIITYFKSAWNVISTIFTTVFTLLSDIFAIFAALFSGDWEALWKNVKKFFSDAVLGLVNILSTVFNGIVAVLSSIWSVISEKVEGIVQTIIEGIGKAVEWIKSLPEQALEWGRNLIDSLVEGIKNALGGLWDILATVGEKIASFFGFDVDIPSPSDGGSTGNGGSTHTSGAFQSVMDDMGSLSGADTVSAATRNTLGATNNVKNNNVVQNVEINNEFNGDTAIQQKAASTMDKSAKDATDELARGLAYAR